MRIGVNTLFLVPGDVGGTEVYLRENLKEMIPGNPQDHFRAFHLEGTTINRLRQDLGRYDQRRICVPFRFRALSPTAANHDAEQTLLPWKAWRSTA
jgi:hypothetical protein